MAEIVSCPHCERSLRVLDDLFGKQVKCPTCGATFIVRTARAGQNPPESPFEEVPEDETTPKERPSAIRQRLAAMEEQATLRRSQEDLDEDDGGYDEVNQRTSRSDRPRRRRFRGKPHRGNLILIFGVLAWLSGLGFIFGPMAWVMGNNDLAEMQAGKMDRRGESLTSAGRLLGIIATVFTLISGLCGIGLFLFFLIMGLRTRH